MSGRLPPFLWSSIDSLSKAQQAHAMIILLGDPHPHSLNLLLSKLTDLRCPIEYTSSLFRRISSPDGFSYASQIRAFTISNLHAHAVSLYKEQVLLGLKPYNLAYPFLLKASYHLSMADLGKQLHAHVSKLGFIADIFISNSLITMYCKCSLLNYAHKLFDEMPQRDLVSWNSIISGYAASGMTDEAVMIFEEMPENRNVVSWTSVIDGLGREGRIPDMLSFFRRMVISSEGPCANAVTMVSLLAACSAASIVFAGKWVSKFIDINSISLNVMLSTALVDMYCRCGELTEARRRFDLAPVKNLATWNAMIGGYVHAGYPEHAVHLFSFMEESTSLVPDDITMVHVLSAFACMGALEKGKQAHVDLLRRKSTVNVFLTTSLVNMYAKCGEIDLACLVFIKEGSKDLGLWNAMINGLATHGRASEALTLFSHMRSAHVEPDGVTFTGILSACSHAGCVNMGRENFMKMVNVYGLVPSLEHYACIVDVLGRAGHIGEALDLVMSMEMEPDHVIWGSLLNSCMIHHETKIAQMIHVKIEPNVGCSMILSNILASKGSWDDVASVRRRVKESGIKKVYGCSWIEVDGIIHRFLVEDTTHETCSELYAILGSLMDVLGIEDVEQKDHEVMNDID